MHHSRKTIFIADLHLDKSFPDALSAFQQYFSQLSSQSIDAVYILGDLFEYWLGDDCLDETSRFVAKTLSDYQIKTKVPLYFIHGNRDFLLAEGYAKQCRMKILAELEVISLYGIKTLIMHGDTLCTDDVEYQMFRKKVRSSCWQKKILRLPVWMRRLKAMQMRRQSKKANSTKSTVMMDVSPDSFRAIMQEHEALQLIHGHTHRPDIHETVLNGRLVKRFVVGDWYTQGSVLEVTKERSELKSIPL